jgi:hypothetical protein
MNPMKRALTVLALVLVALPAWSQSSGSTDVSLAEKAEKAKKERASRRAAGGTPSKSFGNDDLKGGGGGSATTSSATAPSSESAAKGDGKTAKGEKTEEQARAERRDAIQKQVPEEQKRIALIEKTMADAQRELGDITNYSYGTRRAALQKFLDDGAAELATARQKVGDLEEEARRLGASASR